VSTLLHAQQPPSRPVPQQDRDAAASHRLHGDVLRDEGDLTGALTEYRVASRLIGGSDPDLLKSMATVHKWRRDYSGARELLARAIEERPGDAEAREDLEALFMQRGVHFAGSYGGWEVDYSRNVYDLNVFAGAADWLDLRGGYSKSDRVFYERSNIWLDAYLFPSYNLCVRLGAQRKEYLYPRSFVSPDDNAYAVVPSFQFEANYTYHTDNYISLEAEYFTPSFYWQRNQRAHNAKVGVTLRNWLVRPVYAKLFGAILRDPDPGSFVMDPVIGGIDAFRYARQSLVGGAVGIDAARWNAEIKVVPDRDLDRSIDWSLFGRVRYVAGAALLQYDFLYDVYPLSPSRQVGSSKVHMFTVGLEPIRLLEVRLGAKTLMREVTSVSPFVLVRVKTWL